MITFLEVTIYWLCFYSETFRRWNWTNFCFGFRMVSVRFVIGL